MEPLKKILSTPVWQMTGEEQYRLIQYALGNGTPPVPPDGVSTSPIMPGAHRPSPRAAGVHALAVQLECCDSLIYKLRRERVLDEAIVSRIGKKIVFDVEIARRCANEYQEQQRALRSDNE